MKKILSPIISKLGILLTGVSMLFLGSCAHKQCATYSSTPQTDIIWNSPSAVNHAESDEVVAKADKELTKKDFQALVAEQLVAGKSDAKLSFKEKVASKMIANKLNKAYKKMTPTQKAELKKNLETAKGNDGLKKGVIVILVGIGVCILATLFWGIIGIIGTLVWVIGALVILYGIWLLLEELVF